MSHQDQYLDSIKMDLAEWDENFRNANKTFKEFTELRELYNQYADGKVVLNDDDSKHSDLKKMINKKGENVLSHLDKKVKDAKRDRDHNRTGTTKLRLELKRAQESSKSSKKTKGEIKKSGNRYYQTWTTPNHELAKKYQTDRAKPRDVYLQIRYICVEEPETIEHAKMVKKLKMYKEALPDEPCEEVFKKFLQDRLDLIEKIKHKETYTKGFLLRTVATILSPEDREKVRAYLLTQEHSRSMSYLADAIRMSKLQQAHERSGKEGLVSLNVKSKEFQNHFAATQNYYERARSGFIGAKRGRGSFGRGGRGNSQTRFNKSSGNSSNNQKFQQNNQQANQQNGNGFTKGQKKKKKSGNGSNNVNQNQNQNAGRGQNQQQNQNGQNCKSPKSPIIVPKYDTTKIPAGLSHWADDKVDPRVRQLMDKHFQAENIVIKTPPKGNEMI